MKVEILEQKLSSDGYYGELGDRFTVPDNVGEKWCEQGWAKDLSGNVATKERVVINPVLNVENSVTISQNESQ